MKDVTLILQRIQEGQSEASQDLFPAVYDELRRLAAAKMTFERVDHTLSSTALVHEAYVRLVDTEKVQHWESRGHFFTAAAESMRRILVDHARGKATSKRGGDHHKEHAKALEFGQLSADPGLLLDIDEGLARLEAEHAESAELLKLVLFAGSSIVDAGRTLGMTRHVAYRHWDFTLRWFAVYFDHQAA